MFNFYRGDSRCAGDLLGGISQTLGGGDAD
jgi:hypothetical protein